jgi:hypothetical protein
MWVSFVFIIVTSNFSLFRSISSPLTTSQSLHPVSRHIVKQRNCVYIRLPHGRSKLLKALQIAASPEHTSTLLSVTKPTATHCCSISNDFWKIICVSDIKLRSVI